MAETIRSVGPVLNKGEFGESVLEAIQADNSDRKIVVEEHESYYRVQVEGECIINFDTVGEMLGADVTSSEVEQNMPSFEGFIRVSSSQIKFV